MATPHNSAEINEIAKTVLMPGDPLRAKYVAENFLEDAKLVNNVRGIQGYTGKYKGKPITVMASGMGMPSIGIYSYELFKFYDVDNIIRIGSAGSFLEEVKIFDIVLASKSYSESTYAKVQSGYDKDYTLPSEELNNKIKATANELGIKIHEGPIHSGDVFYTEESAPKKVYDEQCLAAEMESFALFANARVLGKNAACIVTISDSIVTHEETTSEQREKSFTEMMKLALESAIKE